MKTIKLQASNLAKLTGHNKYEAKEKTIHNILNFNKIKKIHIPKSNIEETLMKLDPTTIQTIKKEMNLDPNCDINVVENTIKRVIMGKSYSKNISEDQSRALIHNNLNGKEGLKTLETSIKKDLMMRRGNIKENNNLDHIQKKRNIVIGSRNTKMYEKVLYTSPDNVYELVVRGKMDGITDEYIVETKNRTKRLFNSIPDYELVQLETYMFLSDMKNAIHIEHYDDDSNEVKYNHDEVFWQDCINKIVNYIDVNIRPYLIE